MLYDDPVTVPAGDIADNPYWKRDTRRNYPRLSVVGQADAVALLTVGNAAQGAKVELIGEAGSKALVAAAAEGEEKGLAKVFEEKGVDVMADLMVDGLPPLPSGQSLKKGEWDVHPWEMTEEQAYPEKYVYLCWARKRRYWATWLIFISQVPMQDIPVDESIGGRFRAWRTACCRHSKPKKISHKNGIDFSILAWFDQLDYEWCCNLCIACLFSQLRDWFQDSNRGTSFVDVFLCKLSTRDDISYVS